MDSLVQTYGDGILVYEPLYSYVENLADIVGTYRNLPVSISLIEAPVMALKELLGDVRLDLADQLYVSISLTAISWLLVQKLAGKIYRGVRQEVGPIKMELAMFPDAPTEGTDTTVGQVISASTVE